MRISVFVKLFLGARGRAKCGASGRIGMSVRQNKTAEATQPTTSCLSVSARPLDHLSAGSLMGPAGFNFTLLLPLTADVFRGPQWMPETTDRNGS